MVYEKKKTTPVDIEMDEQAEILNVLLFNLAASQIQFLIRC